MSTRMPPRGRTPQRAPYKPPAAREEYQTPAQPQKGRHRAFDFVIILVVVALVAAFAIVYAGPITTAGGSPTLNLGGKTAKPGKASPGATATAQGAPVSDRPMITEVMSSNTGSITAEDGSYYDWIELYNPTDRTINLVGFALSDNLKKPTKSVLPAYSLEPGKYAIVYADGNKSTETELHAAFKLKASGSPLTLVDPNGYEVQSLTMPALETNFSYALGADGKWAATDKYTPGFPNTNEGYGAYEQTRRSTAGIAIDEVMAGNTLTIKDEDGDYSDWVELYNPTDQAVDITGWGLSNKESEPKRWVFPKMTIEPKQYVVVFASGKNRAEAGKELHADFRINAYKDTVLLSNLRGQIVSEVQISDLKPDESWAQVPGSDKWQAFSHPTPGYPNNEEGWNALQPKLYDSGADEPVVINEVMSGNANTVKDQFGGYPDWVELYNRSDKAVDLKDYGLTDKSDELGRWKFPDITLDAGQYLTVFASGRNLTDAEAVSGRKLHTDFAIGGGGGVVALTAPDGHVADRCFVPALHVGYSYGRLKGDPAFRYFDDPTPGAANGGGYPGQAPDPVFSIKAGMYDSSQKVELSSDDPEAKIYYTTNGDPPTDRSTPYNGPIEVKKPDKEFGATVIRAIAYRDGYLPSNAVCSTYIIGQSITLPVLSIAVDNDAMFDPTTGMYMMGPGVKKPDEYPFFGANFWKDTELPAHLELIEADGTVGISQDIGLQIAGQYSRGDVYKGFDMIARSEYGKNSFDYPIFPDQSYASYKAIISRPGGQDVKISGMRDVLVGSLARDTIPTDASGGPSVYVQDYRTALEFVNGEFWGVTQIREKIDEHTLAQHYPGVDETKLDIVQGTGDIVKAGSKKDYTDLIDYVKTHDLSDPDNYKYVTDRMDVDSYINWFTLELCCGNSDMANIRVWKSPNLDNKWRWIFYDFCWTIWYPNVDRSDIHLDFEGPKTGASTNRALIQALLKNKSFKDKFLKQLAYDINVTFDPDTAVKRIDEIADRMSPYMAAEKAKWRELSLQNPQTSGFLNWDKKVEDLRKYCREHPALLKQQMKSYFHLSDAQMAELFPN